MSPLRYIRYRETYKVRTYEVDSNKQITIPALLTLMQETAMQQVIKMKVSLWDLEALNMSWVMMRMQLKIHRLPQLGEELIITTNPAGFEKLLTYRDYRVYDHNEKLIATAASTWLMMDTQKRRMTRIPEYILEYTPPPDHPLLPRPLNKLPLIETPFTEKKHWEVNWHDLDFNEHLSNVNYIKWIVETMEDEYLRKRQLKQLDLIFRAESLWKDEVLGLIQATEEHTFRHR
ncbi:MAG: acyl-ACP thioesterase domain-containing protein, partial [Bacteroidota bacterium]